LFGGVITTAGVNLLAETIANNVDLTINRVVFGSGIVDSSTDLYDLTALVSPVAEGTSSTPSVDGSTLTMTVEYRNDLNGGLDAPFTINEFGIYAVDADGGEVLLYYATLEDYPQYALAYEAGVVDIHRFPVAFTFTDGGQVTLVYTAGAFVTSSELQTFCTEVCLPKVQEMINASIAEHDKDADAHADLRSALAQLTARVRVLELSGGSGSYDGTYETTFSDLDDADVTGVWNVAQARVEF